MDKWANPFANQFNTAETGKTAGAGASGTKVAQAELSAAAALSFDRCPGSPALKRSLQHALAGRFPQTVLLAGDNSQALHTLATVVAATLLCERAGNGGSESESARAWGEARPCGVCAACRKVAAGCHPELRVIDEGDAELKVELARQLKAENSVIPGEGSRRVTILHHAQQLNASAQNALLKELEEPPSYAFFLLTAEQPDALLPTVQSRCTRFVLEPGFLTVASPLLSVPAAGGIVTGGKTAGSKTTKGKTTRGKTVAEGAADGKTAGEKTAEEDTADAVALLRPYLAALAAQQEMQMMRAALALEKTPRRSLAALFGMLQAALRDAIMIAYGVPASPLCPALQTETTALAAGIPATRLLQVYDFLFLLTERVSRNAGSAAVTCALTSDVYQMAFLA